MSFYWLPSLSSIWLSVMGGDPHKQSYDFLGMVDAEGSV
jgi:hypothetical protein